MITVKKTIAGTKAHAGQRDMGFPIKLLCKVIPFQSKSISGSSGSKGEVECPCYAVNPAYGTIHDGAICCGKTSQKQGKTAPLPGKKEMPALRYL